MNCAAAAPQSWTMPEHVCQKVEHLPTASGPGLCIDAPDRCTAHGVAHMWECYNDLPSQEWVYDAKSGQLRSSRGICLATAGSATSGSSVFMNHCQPGKESQFWTYNASSNVLEGQNGLCLAAALPRVDGSPLYMLACDPENPLQQFRLTPTQCSMGDNTFCHSCDSTFRAPPAKDYADELNGVRVDDVCIDSANGPGGTHSVFVIGDWGGIAGGEGPVPAKKDVLKREFVEGIDDWAQRKVAITMQKMAAKSRPDYILNMGDNFYWSGILAKCGTKIQHVWQPASQWADVFESIYKGEGLDGIPWLGVLGNHDYGGFMFTAAWDQAISYTWNQPEGGRWLTPAQYWRSRAFYPDFSVDYFFVDSNYQDTVVEVDNQHNICGTNNDDNDNCGPERPRNRADCPIWFKELWIEQSKWLRKGLQESPTDWQIVVTHFPTFSGREFWMELAHKYGIDLFLTGHNHDLELYHLETTNPFRPTALVVSGGGGGIMSEGAPLVDGEDSQYGFFELRLSRAEIEILGYSHGGQTRYQTFLHPRQPSHVAPRLTSLSTLNFRVK